MIRYQLVCSQEHAFESWFRDSASYDEQAGRGLLACPVCGDARVTKAIMAPAVYAATREGEELPPADRAVAVALAGEKEVEMRAMLRAFRRFVEANSEPVGERFAEEARKIHYGESAERAIHGQATPVEVKALYEEGIEVAPLPILPDERN